MQTIVISLVLAASIVLIHWAYVDFRFRYRDGIVWFWMLNPAPPLMWIGRALVVTAVIAAFCRFWIRENETYFILVGGLTLAHLISLILLEVLEPR